MKSISFNENWQYRHLNSEEAWQTVTLPHDAMILEDRSDAYLTGINACWFAGKDYEYVKAFDVPADWQGKHIVLEFEGVYRNAEVYINGKKACYRAYGYTNFYVDADEYLSFGKMNEVRVVAKNSDQPNSRWYSGAGIYRPVTLWLSDQEHIALNGVKIKTLSIEPAVVAVTVQTCGNGDVQVQLSKDNAIVATATVATDNGVAYAEIPVPQAHLWSTEDPQLYTCQVNFGTDEVTESFGIRTVVCNAEQGLCINGKRVILRGACIHHDNGILGARCYQEAEERKIRLMKSAGYNAIRSAHNPCSKALLDACDKLGVLVMDEYVDEWYVHKTMYGYANMVDEWWHQDLKDMVDKDYNHPSVVMYSTGNEVGETSEPRGIQLTKDFTEYLHSLDDTRYVSCGINIWFNAMYHMGFGQYSDEKAKKAAEAKSDKDRKKSAVGSEFFNNLAGVMGAGFMKLMATLPICDRVTRDAYANMDVAGYNYGIKRYKHDFKKYPNRVILGSETFCADAYTFWEQAKANNALIGDFVWAGQDYLGEVGVGSWEYKEYAPDFLHGVGWMTAGSGRVDLNGNFLGEALYTRVAFELEDKPQIAVVPVNHTHDSHSPSAWKFSNAIPSWSWRGCDGADAKVEVYSRAPVVELYINGKLVGKKKFKRNCRFDFNVTYHDGEVVAVAKDKQGNELSRNSLKTAEEETFLSVMPEKSMVANGEVCFVPIRFTDKAGIVKPLCREDVTVEVEGGELLAVGSACPYNKYTYNGNVSDTYYGETLAVVKATGAKVIVSARTATLQGKATIGVL